MRVRSLLDPKGTGSAPARSAARPRLRRVPVRLAAMSAVAVAIGLLTAAPAAANHLELGSVVVSDNGPGATSTYTFEGRIGAGNGNAAPGEATLRLDLPAGFDVSSATFDVASSGMRDGPVGLYDVFPTFASFDVDAATGEVFIRGIDRAMNEGMTMFRVVIDTIVNPTVSGAYPVVINMQLPLSPSYTNGTRTATIANGPLASFQVTDPSGNPLGAQVAGEPFDVRIRALDEFGNLVAGTGGGDSFTGTVDLASTAAGTAGLGTTAAFASGELTVQVVLTEASGDVALTVTRTGGTESGAAATFALAPGAADALVVTTQPSATAPGPLGTVVVEVQDAFGNLVVADDASPVTVTLLNGGGAALGGTLTQPTADGVATFADLSIETAGAGYQLAFAHPVADGATSASFTLTAAPAPEPEPEPEPEPATPVDTSSDSDPVVRALPATGADPRALSGLAVLLLGLGAGTVLAGRRLAQRG